jgi:hypothetical protein
VNERSVKACSFIQEGIGGSTRSFRPKDHTSPPLVRARQCSLPHWSSFTSLLMNSLPSALKNGALSTG